jgi:hypothetical protein
MDDTSENGEPQRGGSIERADRHGPRARSVSTDAHEPRTRPPWRYELHDPFAEVTYRLKSLQEIIAKADELGSSRFQVVEDDGRRSQVNKIDGQWRRSDGRELVSEMEPETRQHAASQSRHASQAAAEVAARMEAETERLEHIRKLEVGLHERYVIKRASVMLGTLSLGQTEYRFRGNTSRVAFTESTFKLSTEDNNPSVARSMIDVAEAREWRALRVSGHEDFRRNVWIEATLRGVKALGYEATQADLALLHRERESRARNRIEPAPGNSESRTGNAHGAQSGRGGGRKAVLAALEAVLIAKGIPQKPREAVMAAAGQSLAQRLREGEVHKVKVYDQGAPALAPTATRAPEFQRSRERMAPAR